MSRKRNRSKKKYINYKLTDKINASNHSQASDTQSEIVSNDWSDEVEDYKNNREFHTIGVIPSDLSAGNEQLNGSDEIACQTEDKNSCDDVESVKDNTGNIISDASLTSKSQKNCSNSINQHTQDKSCSNLSIVSSDSQINIVEIPKTEKFVKLLSYFENIKNSTKPEIKKEDRIDDAVIIPKKVTSQSKQAYIESIKQYPEPIKNIIEGPIERTFEFNRLLNKWKERSNSNIK